MNIFILFAALLAPIVKHESPFACNVSALTSAERHRHFAELGPALLAVKSGVRELPDGYELRFPSDRKTVGMLLEWIEQERRCCPFFDISVHFEPEGGSVSMRLTGRPGTKAFLRIVAGDWIRK